MIEEHYESKDTPMNYPAETLSTSTAQDSDPPNDPNILQTDDVLPMTTAIVSALGKNVADGLSQNEIEFQIELSRSTKKRRLLYTSHVCRLLGISNKTWWDFAHSHSLEPARWVTCRSFNLALWPPAMLVGLVVPTRCPKCGRKMTTSKLEWDAPGCRCLDCRIIDEALKK